MVIFSMMKGGTLLITGTHGLVGQYLLKWRAKWNGQIVFTGRGPFRVPALDVIYEEMDITDPKQIQQVFEAYSPDVIIHAAAMAQADACEIDQQEAILQNVTATEYLLNEALRSKAFFIFMSSDFVFSGNDGPYHEGSTPNPVNFYGKTKRMAEEKVSAYAFGFAIIRTVLVYGNVISGTRSNIVSWSKTVLEKAAPFKVVSDQIRSTTYAGDLAHALLVIAEKRAKGIWHIAGRNDLSPYDIVQQVASYLQLDSSFATKVDSSSFTQQATRPLRTPFIIEKARKELGYEPLDFTDAMKLVLNGD